MASDGAAAVLTASDIDDKSLASLLGGQESMEGTVLHYACGDPVATVLFGEAGVASPVDVPVNKLVPLDEVAPSYKRNAISNPLLTALASLARVPTWQLRPSTSPPGYEPIREEILWMHQIRAVVFSALTRVLEQVRAHD